MTQEEKVELMVDYIMKHCLWQFHSRNWDREKQNAGVLGKTRELLCEEAVTLETPADRCYWVDAMVLVEAWRARFAWLQNMTTEAIATLMDALHQRLNYLTITGSLNAELSDKRY